ncbi:hypothetical protein [Cytobacillus horneckiae]|uniref:Uncharacterized protein n=1 Tax=Cytobacillus horneckiae TaxID=549687 RepID=A0A2N0ZJB6_9BACI|nr:hypothetical protein [Cytobacillus horneckiae]MEC1153928.1 hypothetical protein [Cytobacillus horneckiae]MED2938503.1 hypothetical protein [Cytobacillus horneckiae]PKG29556.1 hypothetical protein CWS20_06675 [Cytobacillus horneckiae]
MDLEDVEEHDDSAYINAENTSESLGNEIGSNDQLLQELLPELLWRKIREHILLIDENKRNYQLLRGILQGISTYDNELVDRLLDSVVIDEILGKAYPYLQVSIGVDSKGIDRIIKSLIIDIAPIWQYKYLSYGRYLDSISDNDFCGFLEVISQKPEGDTVSIDIMNRRLHGHQDKRQSEIIVNLGQTLLLNFNYSNRIHSLDYEISNIIKVSFNGDNGKENAKKLCKKIILAIENYELSPREYNNTLYSLASIQPLVFMDCFLDREEISYRLKHVFNEGINSLKNIEPKIILRWCNVNPDTRFPIISSVIIPNYRNEKTGGFEWSSLANEIIKDSKKPVEILNRFKTSFRPNSWSGSLAKMMQERMGLITILKTHENPVIMDWAENKEIELYKEIEDIKKWELSFESERNERFE